MGQGLPGTGEDQAPTPPTHTPKSPENDSKKIKTGLFFSWSHVYAAAVIRTCTD